MSTQKILFSSLNDLTDTSYRYGVYCDWVTSHKYLKTSGSSTTVSELNAGDNTFENYGVGDLISVNVDGTITRRAVTAVGSIPDEVTVSSSVDWENSGNGRAFSYARWLNGTAATSGWFRVAEFSNKSVAVEWVTKNATSLDVKIEGRVAGSNPITIYTKNYTAVGEDIIPITELVDEIRVGAQINTDAGANNVDIRFIGEHFGR